MKKFGSDLEGLNDILVVVAVIKFSLRNFDPCYIMWAGLEGQNNYMLRTRHFTELIYILLEKSLKETCPTVCRQ